MIAKYLILFSLPVIGAVIGWFTNFLAVKMLFHPKEPKKILGLWTIQGVFPKRQKDLAVKLGKMVANELFSTDELKERLTSPNQIDLITKTADQKITGYLNERLPEKYPIINFFLTSEMKTGIKEEVMLEIDDMAPKMIGRYVNGLDEHLDIEAIVSEKVNGFSTERLEELLMSILKKELGFIEKIGFVIGFLVGVIQMVMMIIQMNLIA